MSFSERQDICDPRIRDLGVQLHPFTSDGPYGKYFIGETNVNFDNDFIVLELEELSAKKDLQAVVMFLLMYRITQNMYLSREKPKVCIIDEAWQLLGAGGSGDFIESGYRRARKYNGSFCAATQSIGDFSMSRAAEAAMNNADWMFPVSYTHLDVYKRQVPGSIRRRPPHHPTMKSANFAFPCPCDRQSISPKAQRNR